MYLLSIHKMATKPSENAVWTECYLFCGEQCSQDRGPSRGSRPNPKSFPESRHSFYTECMSCTPTHTQWFTKQQAWGPKMVHTVNKAHKLSMMYTVMGSLTILQFCVIYITLGRLFVAPKISIFKIGWYFNILKTWQGHSCFKEITQGMLQFRGLG